MNHSDKIIQVRQLDNYILGVKGILWLDNRDNFEMNRYTLTETIARNLLTFSWLCSLYMGIDDQDLICCGR